MNRKLIRAIVGFPLGVFLVHTLTLISATFGFGVLADSFYLTGDFVKNIWLQFFISGFIGVLAVSLATLFDTDKDTAFAQAFRHLVTVSLLETSYIVLARIIRGNYMALVIFTLLYILILLGVYLYLYGLTKREVKELNDSLTQKGGKDK